jgi:predicted RNA-binding protein with RPS1 domain
VYTKHILYILHKQFEFAIQTRIVARLKTNQLPPLTSHIWILGHNINDTVSTMAPPPYHDRSGTGKSDQPPPVDSIERGEVVRIEDYGAFVQLERYRGMRGLVHISQIAATRLEQVTDAVSVQDVVWVKVLEVSEEESPDGRPRHKIRLSMKDASQDGSAQDLGAISQANEHASHALESNLNSTIGMGFARDPMAGYSSGSRLVMKHQKRDAQVINGYALVDDTEGELAEPPAPVNVNANVNVAPVAPKAPLGRGRGTTLPAWMTKQDGDEPGPSKGSDKHGSDDDSSGRRHRKRKDKSKRKDRKKHSSRKHDDRPRDSSKRSKRHNSEDEEDEEEEDERRRRKRKSHRRSRSSSEDSAKDRDRSRRRHRDRDKQSDEPERERDRSRSGKSRDQFSDASDDDGVQFQSVEEAKKLIEEIDAKRRGSRDEKSTS